jgi:hypothetical protein
MMVELISAIGLVPAAGREEEQQMIDDDWRRASGRRCGLR